MRIEDLPATGPKSAEVVETQAKNQLRQAMAGRFELREEVPGVSVVGESVRIDFVCRALAPARDQGWPAWWFGIETKAYGLAHQRKRTAAHVLWQAAVYQQSTFSLDGQDIRLDRVLTFPSFARLIQSPAPTGTIGSTFLDGGALAFGKVAGLFRVGELVINPGGIEVYFHGINRQYSDRYGWAKVDYLGAENNHASR